MPDLMQSLGDQIAIAACGDGKRASPAIPASTSAAAATGVLRQHPVPACQSQLGYLPDEGRIAALDPGPAGHLDARGRKELLKFCANRESPAACNWMMYAANPKSICIACRLNRTIPT
jgi:hypothetical protein